MSVKYINKDYLSNQIKSYHDNFINPKIQNIERSMDTINGDVDTQGSVRNIVSTNINRLVNSAPEDFNTLKEISDWIEEHEDEASEMSTAIQNNSNAIETLNGDSSTPGSIEYKLANDVPIIIPETDNIDFSTELNTEQFNLEYATVSIKTGQSFHYKMENDTLYLPLSLWEKQYNYNYRNYINVYFTSDIDNSRYAPHTEMLEYFYEDGVTDTYHATPLVDLSYTTSDSNMKVFKNSRGAALILSNGSDDKGNVLYKVNFNLQFGIDTRNESMIGKWFEFNLITTKSTSKYFGKSKTFKVIITGD